MAKKKSTRKELLRPDELQSLSARAFEALRPHLPKLAAAAVGVALAVVGLTAWARYTDRRAARATEALTRAERIYAADLLPAEGVPPAPADADDVPRFKTAKEKAEASLRAVAKVQADFGSTALAEPAALLEAGLLYDLGRFDEAARRYQALQGSLDEELRLLAREGLGYCYEAKGDVDKALAQFRTLGEDTLRGFYKDRARYHEGRMLERKGDAKGALARYRELLEKFPESTLRDDVQDRVAVLESK